MESPKLKKAAALKYDQKTMDAPTVMASGVGLVADRIVQIAGEASVPIVQDAALVSAILSLEVGDQIPVELYEAVAKVLTFVYRMDKGARS